MPTPKESPKDSTLMLALLAWAKGVTLSSHDYATELYTCGVFYTFNVSNDCSILCHNSLSVSCASSASSCCCASRSRDAGG